MTDEEICELNILRQAIDDVLGYLSDNSCGDPDCCGGPYYTHDEFEAGMQVINSFRGDKS
jgi:hypothetical protein